MRSARCRGCHQNTALHTACAVHRTVIAGSTFERVRYDPIIACRCAGCNTIQGGYHHIGCPDEPCPRCGRLEGCRCPRQAPPPQRVMFADGRVPDEPRELEYGRE